MNKYNPDVNERYRNLDRNDKFVFSNKIWNGITGDEINNIYSSNDLKLNIDKQDIDIKTRHDNELLNRNNEIRILQEKKKLLENIKMEIPIQEKEKEKEIQDTRTYVELKHIQIAENDRLRTEKEKFNELLKDLEIII
jgi:hypothetical protein